MPTVSAKYNEECYTDIKRCEPNTYANMTVQHCMPCLPLYLSIPDRTACIACEDCPPGTYCNYTTGSCELCHELCKTCITFEQCTSCFAGTFLLFYKCLSKCNFPYFEDDVNNLCTVECNPDYFTQVINDDRKCVAICFAPL